MHDGARVLGDQLLAAAGPHRHLVGAVGREEVVLAVAVEVALHRRVHALDVCQGDSPVDQQEIKLRVADAVGAAQAALKDGYLPGGGSVLARLDVPFRDAFEAPFKQLAENNGSNPERLLFHLQDSPFGYGYNFRAETIDKPVNLEKEHVIDAALVIKEAVLNAASIASKLLTTGSAITLNNRDEKHD